MPSQLTIGIVSVSETAGGAEAHTVALGRGLAERGHDVTLYGRCPGWADTTLPHAAAKLGPKWSRRTIARGLMRVPFEQKAVQTIPRRSAYYMQFKREQITLTRILARRAPVIWTEHGRRTRASWGDALFAAYARAAKYVSQIVCVSDEVARDLQSIVAPERLTVISNAIDTNRYAAPSAERKRVLKERLFPGQLHDRPVAVLASRLHLAKRHDRAIEAAISSGVSLIVVGDGPDRVRLERVAGEAANVVFLGQRNDIPDLLAASDLYIYCGADTDGTPLALLEAASCGLPVVGFSGDPGEELVTRCGGLLLPDPHQLTPDATNALLSRPHVGRDYVVSRHGTESWLDAYERAFLQCAG